MKKIKNVLLVRASAAQIKMNGHPLHCPAPLSLKYAQAVLERRGNYNVEIIDCRVTMVTPETILQRINQQSTDIIVISIDSPASEEGISLCQTIKKDQDIFIVGVGSDVAERHEAYLKLNSVFDIIIRGEYELEICSLLEQLNTAEDIDQVIKYYNFEKSRERLLVDNLDDLPTLKWNKEELMRYPYIYPLDYNKRILAGYVSTSRGCPHACTFCSPSVRKSYGRKLRLRSVSKVVDEIEGLSKLGVNVIAFEDDDFTLNAEHVRSMCNEINARRLKIKWACHARVDEVTPDLLKVMKAAGCSLLLFGVESGSQRIVNVLHKLSKNENWRRRAIYAFDHVRKAGIAACAMFIVGSPTESKSDVQESIRLAHDMHPDLIKVHFFTLYPGSVDYKQYNGDQNKNKSHHHYLKPISNLSEMSDKTLRKMQLRFYRTILFNPIFVLSHFIKYLPYYIVNAPGSFRLVKDAGAFLLFGGLSKLDKTN